MKEEVAKGHMSVEGLKTDSLTTVRAYESLENLHVLVGLCTPL